MDTSRIRTALPFLSTLAFASITYAEIRYEVINIGNLPGAEFSNVSAINNNNKVVGTSYTNSGISSRGFLWDQTNGMQQVFAPGLNNTRAHDINDSDYIVGYKVDQNFQATGFTTHNGVWWNNNALDNGTGAATYGINNFNQSVGTDSFAVASPATRWNLGGPATELTGFGGTGASLRINDNGDSVGYGTLNGSFDYMAVLYRYNNLPYLLHNQLPEAATSSQANDINDAGWIVGEYWLPNSRRGAFIFNFELGMQLLPPVDSFVSLKLSGINNTGAAVGSFGESLASPHAAIWTQNEGMLELNNLIDPTLGWDLRTAEDINDNGWITGAGILNGVSTNYVLRPVEAVPEPATMTILALGLGALTARRKKRAQ